MRRRTNKFLLTCALAGALLMAALTQPLRADEGVSSQQVSHAIETGIASLRQSIMMYRGASVTAEGTSALIALALINAGVPLDDADLAPLLAAVAGQANSRTYVVALKAQALSAAQAVSPNKELYKQEIQGAAAWLTAAQLRNGMWTYTLGGGGGDNSNTQFALLGLHEAAKAGAKVPQEIWSNSADHFTKTQAPDGSWGYRGPPGYGSMTVAGLASMYITGQRLLVGGPKAFVQGASPSCGKYKQNPSIAAGTLWMTNNFSVDQNPGHHAQWLHYYLYGMERVGMLSGAANFGQHDWYREGANFLVDRQRNGSWGAAHDTAFAVLFLAKGNRPVLIQKVSWKDKAGSPNPWNRNVHDLENLTAFLGVRLGKAVTWQTTSLTPSVQDLRISPILLITGHEFPKFSADEKTKLRQYVEAGGTLLFEACCGSKVFDAGFRAWAAEMFPEYTLRPLRSEHPVFSSIAEFKTDDTYGLEGIDLGCRTGVFYSPRALDCLWEMQDFKDATTNWSQNALRLGANIAAYATAGEQLGNKLDVVELPPAAQTRPADSPREVPRGAVRIARLEHQGQFNTDIHCLANLAALLRDQAKVDVVAQERSIRPEDPKLFDYPVVFMTGHYSFQLTPTQVDALAKYLSRGGVLIAEPCCGQKAFDTSFRELVKQLFPSDPLTPLDAEHPIYTGKVGVALGEVKYRKTLADELKLRGTNQPPLETVTLKGRTAIIYSKYDFSCALEGDNPSSCRGYIDADGQRLALAIFLFAISY